MMVRKNQYGGYRGLLVFTLLLAGVGTYAYFEARYILQGPAVTLDAGAATTTHDRLFLIRGHTQNAAGLSINGNPTGILTGGRFNEPFVLAPGYNQFSVEATDKTGRTNSAAITILFTPSSTTKATSTSATSTAVGTSTKVTLGTKGATSSEAN